MDPALRDLTARYAAITAVVGFVTQPIPLLDEIVMLPLQGWFAAVFMKRRGYLLRRAPWGRVAAILGGGVGARIVSRFTVGLLPPAGAFANAVTAAAGTVLIATSLDQRGPQGVRPSP